MATDLSHLNPQQYAAVVESFERNTVLVAGAGSGKTAVLQARTSYLVDDMQVDPAQIMVVTFTNKAANELKERLKKVCPDIHKMWLGTFHSICVKILKNFGEDLNIRKFTILDEKDAKAIMKKILDDNGQPIDSANVSRILGQISSYKNNMKSPKHLLDNYPNMEDDIVFIKIYDQYQRETWSKRTFDFDDLIYYTVLLLKKSERVREWFYYNVKYVMIDECQDTNSSQFELMRLIVGPNNLLMVGDDDQSIYSFRDAKPEYLLNFETFFRGAQTLKLEQNYRSTKRIIEASNVVVSKNTIRSDKTMFTENKKGDPILYHRTETNRDEAEWVVKEIQTLKQQGIDYDKQAILYRTNAQTRLVEEYLLKMNIPYHIVGGFRFYDREEIKDLMAFFKLRVNPRDDMSLKRILKLVPTIGDKTADNLIDLAKVENVTYTQAFLKYPFTKRQRAHVDNIKPLLIEGYDSLQSFIRDVIKRTGIVDRYVKVNTGESRGRIENIKEFVSIIIEQENSGECQSIDDFVNSISLASAKEEQEDGVTLMTIHSSKGLEFEYVFMVGVEESLLPHGNSLFSPACIEEERRLMYVGMTRAKEQLYILNCKSRIDVYSGRVIRNPESRFIADIPKHCLMAV